MAEPVRTCIGCRQRFGVRHLVRISLGTSGDLVVGRANIGRGVWLCRGSSGCAQRAERSGAFARGLRVSLSSEAVASAVAAVTSDPGDQEHR